MMVIEQIPALQVVLPLVGAVVSIIMKRIYLARNITLAVTATCLVLSIFTYGVSELPISYVFGGWPVPKGIEYRLDGLNQAIIIFVNCILLFVLLFGQNQIEQNVLSNIKSSQEYLFYVMLLFAHCGYVGILSTNDLFNLYVFIEISALATYVLMSLGSNKAAPVGAFDYLIVGTIGASLMLLGIGFIFAETGTLNMLDAARIIAELEQASSLIPLAIIFFIGGAILKVAFFPMHFWLMRAYRGAEPIVMCYLASISSMMGIYIILRFVDYTIDTVQLFYLEQYLIRPFALAGILLCSYFAMTANDLTKLVIYSTCSQIGYIFLLLILPSERSLLLLYICFDGVAKLSLFFMLATMQDKYASFSFDRTVWIKDSYLFKTMAAFTLIYSAAMPLSATFIIKVELLSILLKHSLLLDFAVIITASVMSMIYHFKVAKLIFYSTAEEEHKNYVLLEHNIAGLVALVIIQFCMLGLLYE